MVQLRDEQKPKWYVRHMYKVGQSIEHWTVFISVIGLHVLLKLMVVYVGVCWGTDCPYSMLTLFFLAMAYWPQWNEVHVLWMYSAACQAHSLMMDECREARLAWGIAWTFACKRLQVKKSSKFEFGECGGHSAGSRIPPRIAGCSWQYWLFSKSTGRSFFHQDTSWASALTDRQAETSYRLSAKAALIPLALLFSTPLPWWQVHAVN